MAEVFPSIGLWGSCIIATIALLVITRITSGILSSRTIGKDSNGIRQVPAMSYWIPFLGNVPDFAIWASKILKAHRDGKAGLISVNFFNTTHTMVFSPKMIQTVFAQKPTVLSFDAFIWFICNTIGGVPSQAKKKYAAALHDLEAAYYALLREPYLSELIAKFVDKLEQSIHDFVPVQGGNESSPWLKTANIKQVKANCGRDTIQASLLPLVVSYTGHLAVPSIFGIDLLRNFPSLLNDVLAFNDGFILLALGLPPWVPWPKVQRARSGRDAAIRSLAEFEVAVDAVAAGQDPGPKWPHMDTVSELVRIRGEAFRKYKITPMERVDCMFVWALNANSNFVIFWTLLRILSTPGLADEVRKESAAFITYHPHAETEKSLKINEKSLSSRCSLLKACLIECLRLDSATWSSKTVEKDFILAQPDLDNAHPGTQYMVKRGTYVHVPSDLHFTDPKYFPSPEEFRPERHLAPSTTGQGDKRAHWGTIRPWGGGSTVCKGRLYAEREVMTTIAALLAVYDFEPVGGEWKFPAKKKATGVMVTDDDVRVLITKRTH